MELSYLILTITGIFVVIVTIASAIAWRQVRGKIDTTTNIYYGKLSNTDASIQDAVKYLKLTNGILERSQK